MANIIKAGFVELTEEEAFYIYQSGKYVVSYSGIYQPHYSNAQKTVYFSKVCSQKGLARHGRFYVLDAAFINKLLGYELLNVD
jgi:hypothetical protein